METFDKHGESNKPLGGVIVYSRPPPAGAPNKLPPEVAPASTEQTLSVVFNTIQLCSWALSCCKVRSESAKSRLRMDFLHT